MEIWWAVKSILDIFIAHDGKRLFRSFRSKIWPHHSIRRPQFPVTQVYFHIGWRLQNIFWCLGAQFSCDLVTLTFDHFTLTMSHILSSYIRRTYQFWVSDDYPFLSYGWLFPSHGVSPRHVTHHQGANNDPHFKNRWPQLVCSLYNLHSATTKIKLCNVSHCEG